MCEGGAFVAAELQRRGGSFAVSGLPTRCRHTTIVSSTRLYIARFLARPMQFPLLEKLAGELTLSEQPVKTMRNCREELLTWKTDPAHHMRVSDTLINDLETDRSISPRMK